jgi:hypothetical protein
MRMIAKKNETLRKGTIIAVAMTELPSQRVRQSIGD